jgi:hypothetical protein
MTGRRIALENKETLCAAILVGVALSLAACGSSSPATGTGGSGAGGMAVDGGGKGGGTGGKGTGGKTGTGGVGVGGSVACSTSAPYEQVFNFGSITEGWDINSYSTSPPQPAPGTDAGPNAGTQISIDSADGFPVANGSLKLAIPFDGPSQTLIFEKLYSAPGVNMAGATISAYIKLDSGVNASITSAARALFVLKTTASYNYAPGNPITLDSSAGWKLLTISADAPAMVPVGYDPCSVYEIDLQIETGTSGTYSAGVVHIDTISISRSGTDAGPGDALAPSDAIDAPASSDAADAPAPSDTGTPTDTAGDTGTGG